MDVAIVEDNTYNARSLIGLLHIWKGKFGKSLSISSYLSGEEALEDINKILAADIVFIDIGLSGINGLAFARQLRQHNYTNAIVFVTSYESFTYAKEGYDLGAIQYLVKPVSLVDIEKCMEKINSADSFIYHIKGGHVKIPYRNIVLFEVQNHYVNIVTTNNTNTSDYTFKQNLSDLTAVLPENFVQIHRSYIININHLARIKDKVVTMNNGFNVSVGKKYYDNLVEKLMS